LHPHQRRPGQLPIKPLGFSRGMLKFLFSRLPRRRLQPTNLLPTRVIIASYNQHRRLLPTDSFGPPNRSIPVTRTEPSLLSNQLFFIEWTASARYVLLASQKRGLQNEVQHLIGEEPEVTRARDRER